MVTFGENVLIHDLKRQGLTMTAIARNVGLDRKTVRQYLECGLEMPAYSPRAPEERLIAPYEEYLRERVSAYPELSGKRLLLEIREFGYTGGYTAVTDPLQLCPGRWCLRRSDACLRRLARRVTLRPAVAGDVVRLAQLGDARHAHVSAGDRPLVVLLQHQLAH